MRNIFLCFLLQLAFIYFAHSQGQFGITAGGTIMKLGSNSLISQGSLGYEVGVQFLSGLHRKGDLILEFTYSENRQLLLGESVIDNNLADFDFAIKNYNLNFLYHQYFIIPEGYKPHIGLQGGLAFSILNSWSANEEEVNNHTFGTGNYDISDFDNLSPFHTNAVIGFSGGFEQLRFSLRYYKSLTNVFSRRIGEAEDDMFAKPQRIALSVSYFFDKFY